MNKIISLNEYNADPLVTLRAGALLVQDIIKQQFFHENARELLDNKKIGMVATERIAVNGETVFCVISTLCEALDFSRLSHKVVYDYNNQSSIILKQHLGTEIFPILRFITNEDKTKVLIIEDRIKYDFFSFGTSTQSKPSLLYQLLSGKELLQDISDQKISNVFSIIYNREAKPLNNYSGTWRNNFIDLQRIHLMEADKNNNLNLLARYEQGLQDYFHLR